MSITYEHVRCGCCGRLTNLDFLDTCGEFEDCCGSCCNKLNKGKTKEEVRKEYNDFEKYNTREAGIEFEIQKQIKFCLDEIVRLKEEVCDKWEEYNNCTETELIGKLWIEAHRLEERLLVYKEFVRVDEK